MGHVGASRKSPYDVPWETLSLRLSRPISAPLLKGHLQGTCTTPDTCQGTCRVPAPLLTAALSWRYEEEAAGSRPSLVT